MEIRRIEDFEKGWFIGDFQPSVVQTEGFEVAMKSYRTGDLEPNHKHLVAKEFTIISSGRFRMNDMEISTGDIVEIAPGDATDFECLESGTTFVVKIPSVRGDKYIESKGN